MNEVEVSKMRKRNDSCSTPSSSSRRKYRFKRAIVMGKRGCSSTPTNANANANANGAAQEDVGSVSARKLGATLWENQNNPATNDYQQKHDHVDDHKLKGGLNEVMKGVVVSKELVKVLRSVWDQRSVSGPLLSALRFEVEEAAQRLARHVAHEDVWRERLGAEVRRERRLRRQAEHLNRKLGRELARSRASSLLLQHQVAEERHMLQLAHVLREERVQMKLSDAKFEFEEKNAALDLLRHQLQAYFTCIPNHNHDHHPSHNDDDDHHPSSSPSDDDDRSDDENGDGDGSDDENGDDDLHSISIELSSSIDKKQTYKWSVTDNVDWDNISFNASVTHQINKYVSLNPHALLSPSPSPSPSPSLKLKRSP